MGVYNEPKTFAELSAWHANRLPFKTERLGQAYCNDFSCTSEQIYYEKCPTRAWELIIEKLESETFWSDL